MSAAGTAAILLRIKCWQTGTVCSGHPVPLTHHRHHHPPEALLSGLCPNPCTTPPLPKNVLRAPTGSGAPRESSNLLGFIFQLHFPITNVMWMMQKSSNRGMCDARGEMSLPARPPCARWCPLRSYPPRRVKAYVKIRIPLDTHLPRALPAPGVWSDAHVLSPCPLRLFPCVWVTTSRRPVRALEHCSNSTGQGW